MNFKSTLILAVLGLVYMTSSVKSASISNSGTTKLVIEDEEQKQQQQVDEIKQLQSLLFHEIMENAVLRNRLRSFIDSDMQEQETDENENNDDDDDNNTVGQTDSGDSNRRLFIAKRFPKWRSGDTRSRVRLLHQNDARHHHAVAAPSSGSASGSSSGSSAVDYSSLLRNRWENNMLEKNRMYQNLLG